MKKKERERERREGKGGKRREGRKEERKEDPINHLILPVHSPKSLGLYTFSHFTLTLPACVTPTTLSL